MLTEVSPDKATPSSAVPPAAPVRSAWWARLVSRLPLPVLYGLSSLLGWLTHRLHVVRENLGKAFPGLDAAGLRAVIRAYYMGFADMLVEVVKAVSMPPEEFRRRVSMVNVEAPRALLASGQPVLL